MNAWEIYRDEKTWQNCDLDWPAPSSCPHGHEHSRDTFDECEKILPVNPQLRTGSPSRMYQQNYYQPSSMYGIDPRLAATQHHLVPTSQPRPATPRATHVRRSSNDSVNSMGPPSGLSPRLNRSTPGRGSPMPSGYRPSDRALPMRDVAADTITDAYVAFILYCNPAFPLDVDPTTLRTNFQSPPKSDNKDFDVFRLFHLLKKLDAKEIKTWGQLALDLGVEPPDVSKGQSVQKVQQYSVRLKRWMRAMHIDAFFEYLLGKQHVYFNEIPPPNDPHPVNGRDGVHAEEDLAIRALDPSFRPKRGRRRNSDISRDENADSEPASKQARLGPPEHSQSAYPASAIPFSALPGGFHDPWAAAASAITPNTFGPWSNRSAIPQSAISPTAPLRWPLHGQEIATPHPMTAQPLSMAAHIEAAFDIEPRSAITPSGRKRRKHGPAVSSAWPSTNGPGAKPRGRPPASRNIQDGPFTTFPADPANNIIRTVTPDTYPAAEQIPSPPLLPSALVSRNSDASARPGRLSLQVPQHNGGPIRLATPPPPKVLVNGETSENERSSESRTPITEIPTRTGTNHLRKTRDIGDVQVVERDIPGFAFEVLKRVLTSDLLRATLVGRRSRLLGDEAKRLADAALERFGVPRTDTDDSKDDVARLTAASWLGLGEKLNVPLGPAVSQGKTITVTRFRTDADGYEELVSASQDPSPNIREVYDIAWTTVLGACHGTFELKGLTFTTPRREEDTHDMLLRKSTLAAKQMTADGDAAFAQGLRRVVDVSREGKDGGNDGIDWRARALAMEFGGQMAKGEMNRVRDRIVQAVLDAVL